MLKKLTLVACAIALVAFAVPALAAAKPALTNAKGKDVAVGTLITGTSTNTTTKTPFGTLECAKVVLNGKVTASSETGAEGAGTGEGTTATCSEGGVSITITDVTLTSLKTTTDLNGTAGFHFVADVPLIGTCTFDATAAPFTYAAGSNQIKFNAATLTASPSFCAPASLTGTFTLAETSGGALSFD